MEKPGGPERMVFVQRREFCSVASLEQLAFIRLLVVVYKDQPARAEIKNLLHMTLCDVHLYSPSERNDCQGRECFRKTASGSVTSRDRFPAGKPDVPLPPCLLAMVVLIFPLSLQYSLPACLPSMGPPTRNLVSWAPFTASSDTSLKIPPPSPSSPTLKHVPLFLGRYR